MNCKEERLSRRSILKTALGGCTLIPGSSLFIGTVVAAGNEFSEMRPTQLINALRAIGKPVCIDAANTLMKMVNAGSAYNLHLRNADLNDADARMLADAMLQTNTDNHQLLASFSASFNPGLGDTGATMLAKGFPGTMIELGLVGCNIGDSGGLEILKWAKNAPDLRTLCIEGNRFSTDMRSQFYALAKNGRQLHVVV
ncbi:MAG: hypothetical protein AB8B87_23350 [Granulosicoccus sp.]